MKEITKQAQESAHAKLDIIMGIVGPDSDMALAILSYALMHVAHDNRVMFASVIQNLALLEIIKQQGADDEE
jgi:hypothetical protein